MNLDQQLRRALERQEPPPGFEKRVLSARRAGGTARWTALGLAASLLIGLGGFWYWTDRQEVLRAERARREVEIALLITGEKLNQIQIKVADIARRTTNDDTFQKR